MTLQHAIVMTPEYLEEFADKVSSRVLEKMEPKIAEQPLDAVKAAKHLNVSKDHLLKMIRAGEPIPHHKKPGLPYEFFALELNEYLKKK